jgi:hypothetical protein
VSRASQELALYTSAHTLAMKASATQLGPLVRDVPIALARRLTSLQLASTHITVPFMIIWPMESKFTRLTHLHAPYMHLRSQDQARLPPTLTHLACEPFGRACHLESLTRLTHLQLFHGQLSGHYHFPVTIKVSQPLEELCLSLGHTLDSPLLDQFWVINHTPQSLTIRAWPLHSVKHHITRTRPLLPGWEPPMASLLTRVKRLSLVNLKFKDAVAHTQFYRQFDCVEELKESGVEHHCVIGHPGLMGGVYHLTLLPSLKKTTIE